MNDRQMAAKFVVVLVLFFVFLLVVFQNRLANRPLLREWICVDILIEIDNRREAAIKSKVDLNLRITRVLHRVDVLKVDVKLFCLT